MANNSVSVFTDVGDYNIAMRSIQNTHIPKAIAETLNFTADQVTKEQIKNVKGDFIVRTPFTLKSMESGRAKPFKALNKASGTNLKTMFSRAGTNSPYLWMQEEGANITGIDGPIPIATQEARVSKSLRKAIAKRNRINKSERLKRGEFGSSGSMFIGMPKGGGRRYGLYKRHNNNKKLTMLRNMETSKAKIKPTHFHEKAVNRKGNNSQIAQRYRKFGQKHINRAARRG